MRWGWHDKGCPLPSPTPTSAVWEYGDRQPPPLAADLYFSSRLLLYTFIKSTFKDGNSVGGFAQIPSLKAKLLWVFASCPLSSGVPFFFLSFLS